MQILASSQPKQVLRNSAYEEICILAHRNRMNILKCDLTVLSQLLVHLRANLLYYVFGLVWSDPAQIKMTGRGEKFSSEKLFIRC